MGRYVFSYDKRFLSNGLEISPRNLPLSKDTYTAETNSDLYDLHGVFADSLPDEWGKKVQDAWRALGEKCSLPIVVNESYPALAHFYFEHDSAQELRTLYVQEMLKKGFLATPEIYVTLAHDDQVIDEYIVAIDEVFREISAILVKGNIQEHLNGPVAYAGFKRLTN